MEPNIDTLKICELWEETIGDLPRKEVIVPSICLMHVTLESHVFEEPICIFHAPQAIRSYIDSGQEVELLMFHPEDAIPCTSCLAEANKSMLS